MVRVWEDHRRKSTNRSLGDRVCGVLAGSGVRQPGAACTGCDDRLVEDRLINYSIVDLQPRRNVWKGPGEFGSDVVLIVLLSKRALCMAWHHGMVQKTAIQSR